VLNKQICRKCYHHLMKNDMLVEFFDDWWELGWVHCCLHFYASFKVNDEIPEKCVYHLEHVVSQC
jgi:hypothetical protein